MSRKTVEPTTHIADGVWGSPPHLKRSFSNSNLEAAPTENLGFVADVTNEFILGLDIIRSYDASVDIGHQTLRLAEDPRGGTPSLKPGVK
jgi:hypothetical protein